MAHAKTFCEVQNVRFFGTEDRVILVGAEIGKANGLHVTFCKSEALSLMETLKSALNNVEEWIEWRKDQIEMGPYREK